jgi:hypothetical protein
MIESLAVSFSRSIATLTGPGTVMGNFFRRFWMPVLLSQELLGLRGPIRARA